MECFDDKAEEVLLMALRIREESELLNSAEAVFTLLRLAKLGEQNGSVSDAEQKARRALALADEQSGERSDLSAECRNVLATILISAGRLDESFVIAKSIPSIRMMSIDKSGRVASMKEI